jgi:hypothetical protein
VIALRNGSVTVEDLDCHRPTFRQSCVSTAVIDSVNRALASPGGWREIHGLP